MEHYVELDLMKAHVQHMVVPRCCSIGQVWLYCVREQERWIAVSEEVFIFFMEIEKQRKLYHNPTAAKQLGNQVLSVAYNKLISDNMLRGICMKIANEECWDYITQLLADLLYKYIPEVANNSSREGLLTDFTVRKEQQALRTKLKI